MARIQEEELTRIKREILVEQRAALELGVIFMGEGANRIGRCPLPGHKDEHPSFVVTPEVNLWHCFGCNEGGSIIDLEMKTKRISFTHAVANLKPLLSFLAADSSPLAASVTRGRTPALTLEASDQSQIKEVVSYYHSCVDEIWPYLEKRGLAYREMVDRHLLGFANRTLGYYLPDKRLKAGREIRARLTEIGILRESGHECMRGSLTVPIFDEAGNVVGLYGRKVRDDLREGTPLHMYLKGKHRGVWNWQGLVDQEEVILCEALIDALTFYAAGFTNVTASYGVNGFTDDHLQAFQRYGTKRVLIAYDADEAGNRGAAELADKLQAIGIKCARIEFPAGTDANEYARELMRQ